MRRLGRWWLAVPLAFVWLAGYELLGRWGVARPAWSVELSLDSLVPFCALAEIPYFLTYAFILAPVVLVREEARFRRLLAAFLLVTAAAFFGFLLFPTMGPARPVPPDHPAGRLLALEYSLDTNANCFPSLHCAYAALAVLALWNRFSGWRGRCALAVLLAVFCASTVLVRQHWLLCIPGGALLGWLAWCVCPSPEAGRPVVESDLGVTREEDGQLFFEGVALTNLAELHGTPLHVVAPCRAADRLGELRRAFARHELQPEIFYPLKSNPLPALLARLQAEGAGVEVCSPFEFELARETGFSADRIVVGGPAKTSEFLGRAFESGARMVVVEGRDELDRLRSLVPIGAGRTGIAIRVRLALRAPGMNPTSDTSRRAHLGFAIRTGEALEALVEAGGLTGGAELGVQAHIGSGIRRPEVFAKAIARLADLLARARDRGVEVQVLDLGGGLGVPTARELGTAEWLRYVALDRAPRPCTLPRESIVESYASAVAGSFRRAFEARGLPRPHLFLEPGRILASGAGLLLTRVLDCHESRGETATAICDVGAMTGALMCLSEYHEVLLANRAPEGSREIVHLVGSLPSPTDVIYRGKEMPPLRAGDLLALADAGAYFLSTEFGFGRPRAAVVAVGPDQPGGKPRQVRRRETFEDMTCRDVW